MSAHIKKNTKNKTHSSFILGLYNVNTSYRREEGCPEKLKSTQEDDECILCGKIVDRAISLCCFFFLLEEGFQSELITYKKKESQIIPSIAFVVTHIFTVKRLKT